MYELIEVVSFLCTAGGHIVILTMCVFPFLASSLNVWWKEKGIDGVGKGEFNCNVAGHLRSLPLVINTLRFVPVYTYKRRGGGAWRGGKNRLTCTCTFGYNAYTYMYMYKYLGKCIACSIVEATPTHIFTQNAYRINKHVTIFFGMCIQDI